MDNLHVALFGLAFFLNFPHFAVSYILFYGGYAAMLKNPGRGEPLKSNYVLAGIVVPLALLIYFGVAIGSGLEPLLQLGVNLMFFTVGWHYVKQGYGMLMLDAALKKRFYSAREKQAFLINSYVAWAFSWLLVNYLNQDNELFGIHNYVVPVPLGFVLIGGVFAAAALGVCVFLLVRRARETGFVAWNGVVGYFASIYAWLVLSP